MMQKKSHARFLHFSVHSFVISAWIFRIISNWWTNDLFFSFTKWSFLGLILLTMVFFLVIDCARLIDFYAISHGSLSKQAQQNILFVCVKLSNNINSVFFFFKFHQLKCCLSNRVILERLTGKIWVFFHYY